MWDWRASPDPPSPQPSVLPFRGGGRLFSFPLRLALFFLSHLQTEPAGALRFWLLNLYPRVQACPSV